MGKEPHYIGHRKRLRERFLKVGPDGLADYELLELVLFGAQPRRDVKPLAKALMERFGFFAEVISADPQSMATSRASAKAPSSPSNRPRPRRCA